MYVGQSSWTEERIDLLKRLWADGLSASQIAAELGGITRNAVIGKVTRLDLSGRASPAKIIRTPRGPREQRTTQRRVPHSMFVGDDKPCLNVQSFEVPVEQRKSLLQLTAGVCKFPYGDPGSPDFYFCGGVSVNGEPYCSAHARIAYTPYALRKAAGRTSYDIFARSRFTS
jgi:GcrA cell cycle regulator